VLASGAAFFRTSIPHFRSKRALSRSQCRRRRGGCDLKTSPPTVIKFPVELGRAEDDDRASLP